MVGNHSLNESVGLLKRGAIVKYIAKTGILKVRLNTAGALKGSTLPVDVQAPHSLFYNNGLFIGSLPVEGTPVIVGQGSGGKYYFVSFLAEDLPVVPNLSLGVLLIRSNNDTQVTLDVNNNISIGSLTNNIHINTQANYSSTNFYNEYHFTQAARKIDGIIKRDLAFNTNFSQSAKLESDDYDARFKVIAMDPTTTPTSTVVGTNKNPPLVENREMIYEFQYISNIEDDLTESNRYGKDTSSSNTVFTFPNRRISRSDTLSLSLVAPNYLIETVKGTVVDIFGNLLDLNRFPLPIGKGQNTINSEKSTDKVKSFLLIKELERKSLAYHFEINARKDLVGVTGVAPALPNINSSADYARNRSRFFIDIDKEGQFKINIPASSEKGNIPLLTRYENYSTFGDDDNNNPNKLVYRTDGVDIYQDSFIAAGLNSTDGSKGVIKIVNGDNSDAAPQDRIIKQVIKHGMVYHDIMSTCQAHQNNNFLKYQTGEVDPLTVNLDLIPELKNIVSDTIIVSGDSAKAGGRSGSINMDGSLEMNIGANTIDRQSLWLDTAGSIIANVGVDRQGRSVVASTGGDFFLQVGGFGVQGDSRFEALDSVRGTGIKGAVLDLRIFTDGLYCHMIRCDSNGITIMTPGNLAVHAKGAMTLTSDNSVRIEAPVVTIQNRTVLNPAGGSI